MKIYLHPLCLVFVTSRLLPARFDGYSFGPVVLVRPDSSGNASLFANSLLEAHADRKICVVWGLEDGKAGI